MLRREDDKIATLSAGWLLNGKAVTQETLAESSLLAKPETETLVVELREVRAKLAKLALAPASSERDRRIGELDSEQRRIVRELGQARGGDSSADPWVSIQSVRQGLAAKNLLVNLVRLTPDAKKSSPPRYLAWLIPAATGGNIQIVDLGEVQPIDDAVGAFRKAMETATQRVENNDRESKERLEGTLATLAKLVWHPLAAKIGDAHELVLSPDGALWLVPWAALPTEDGAFLVEKFRIRYVTSGGELR